ncbi:hypothetical protein QZH41_008199, partial [Actinostola sp. cb2023]
MWGCILKTLSYIRLRFFSIGYKKRIAIQILLLLFLGVTGVMVKPLLFANLAELDMFNQFNQHSNSSAGWDKWSNEMARKGYRSIGDVYDHCVCLCVCLCISYPKSSRTKIGKVLIHFDKTLGQVVATATANFTMPVSLDKGTVHIIAQYHGQTLFDKKYDLCKTDVDTFKCPLTKGMYYRPSINT